MSDFPQQHDAGRKITGRHVLYILLGFFGVIFAANGALAWLAFDSWTGLVVDKPYERGLKYDQVLQDAAAQKALGWSVDGKFEALGQNRGRIYVVVRDKSGRPISGLNVTGILHRPTLAGFDKEIALSAKDEGYGVEFVAAKAGQWDLKLEAVNAAGERHRYEQRLWLK